jgi:hypothetical protein
VPLQSGPPRSFPTYPPSKHAEGKGAIWIRENDSNGGVLFHNNPGGTCGYCDSQLRTLLPNGVWLDVMPPADAIAKNPNAKAVATSYFGDEKLPKLSPPTRQLDFFGEHR